MATFYSYESTVPEEGGWGSIKLETNDPELHKRITEYINDVIDALNYRKRIEKVSTTGRI